MGFGLSQDGRRQSFDGFSHGKVAVYMEVAAEGSPEDSAHLKRSAPQAYQAAVTRPRDQGLAVDLSGA